MHIMSPERPPSIDGGPILESPNVVLSSVPMESGHIILQQQNGNHVIANGNYGTYTTISASSPSSTIVHQQPSPSSAASSTPSSKLLVLQPNQLNENYVTTESNGVGNIVLLATEQMDIGTFNHNSMQGNKNITEELTSLTWLHDKNLLKGKGINLTCTNSKSNDESPARLNGAISPTSDFVDDSCVSEDNASSANSCSDQGIGICSVETSPTSTYHHYAINNNNTINKNRNHIQFTTPSATSTPMSSEIIYVSSDGSILNSKSVNIPQHSSGRFLQQSQQQQQQPQQIQLQTVPSASLSPVSSIATTVITSTSSSIAPPGHQHFHKKYLREEHNKTLKQTNTLINNLPVKQTYNCPVKYEMETDSILEKDYQTNGHLVATSVNTITIKTESTCNNNMDGFSSPRQTTTTPPPPPQQQQQQPSAPSSKVMQQKLKHPNNLPYDPLIHTTNKPPLSFSSLIYLAIEDSIEKALPVKEIYAWIVAHYPYFKTAPTGWKNSVRHNLSLNKCFQKVEKAPNMGKGSLWRVEQQYKPNLIQALTRSSYHPCSSTIDKTVFKTSPRPLESPPSNKSNTRQLDADLFPRLSRCMAEMVNSNSNNISSSPPSPSIIEDDGSDRNLHHSNRLQQLPTYMNDSNYYSNGEQNSTFNGTAGSIELIARDWGADSIDDVNAATAMLALKHGPKVFSEHFQNGNPPVITSSPSEDHTYSAGGGIGSKRSSNNNSDNNSNGTSSDAAYESSEESQQNNISKEELEARRHAEGVDAFLTFATEVSTMSSPMKRPLSPESHFYIENVSNNHETVHYTNHNSPQPQQQQQMQQSQQQSQQQKQQQHQPQQQHQVQQQPPQQHQQHHQPQQQMYHLPYPYLSSPSPPKKSRSRNLRTKLKKKSWFR